jgi:tetratricopeptide (TPR) repeat protein
MKAVRPVLLFLALFFVLTSGGVSAQRAAAPPSTATPSVNPFETGIATVTSPLSSIIVTVADENGNLLSEQALVKLYSGINNTNTWATTQKRSEAEFDSIAPGDYEVEASAAGFQASTQTISVISSHEVFTVLVRLRLDTSGDSTAAKPGQILAPKAQKEAEKGLAGLKSGKLNDAQKHLEAAYKLAPTNADVNFLLGYLYLQKNDTPDAKTYFEKAASLNPQHIRALTALGQLLMDQHDYKGASVPLEKAASLDSGNWRVHWLLASAYLHLHEYEKCRQQAGSAVESGKGAASAAELVLGDADSNLGKRAEAIQAFQRYLQSNPSGASADAARDAIALLQRPPKLEAVNESTSVAMNQPSTISAAPEPPDAKLSLPSWGPPNVDDEKPLIAAGVTCPADLVIQRAGDRVKELVDNLSNFDATEDVSQEDLDVFGKPITKETRKFDYMATISEPRPGILNVEEVRTGLTDKGGFPGGIATRGVPALAFVFHPDKRDEFDITCEGLGSWKGEATWLVHFRQRPNKPSGMLSFEFTDASVPVDLKGRAWISASTYQIVRLESDVVSPINTIQLFTDHQVVDFGPVQFNKKHIELWLPLDADIYMDFGRERFHRRHSFSHYMLFSVGTTQKISPPKVPDSEPKIQ